MTDHSHDSLPKPTPLLALVALGVVHRFCPAWLAVDLQAAAVEHGVRADRLSRLITGALGLFETVVARLTRRGRPPLERAEQRATAELNLLRELVGVATRVLGRVPLRRRVVGELLVGAFQRLHQQRGISQQRFCHTLGLPARTLRQWLSEPRRTLSPGEPVTEPPPEPPRPRPRPPRRGRFGFDVMLPGTQVGADTTDLCAFDVPLKLIAAQDIGGRDESLFDAVIVDDHESAELVARVFEQALAGKPGAQAITDQGTPYLAACARGALEALGAEHAPQREGDPTGKATVERAFRTVKDIAAPILHLTNRIARAVPELACPSLAKATVELLLGALLRAYQHGGRAGRAALAARDGIDPDELARRAEESRERARATERSARLLLAQVHQLYALPGDERAFVNSLRSYPLTVLQDAERALRAQVHRDDIRDRRSYFAKIVRTIFDEHQRLARITRIEREDDAARAHRDADYHQQLSRLRADPAAWLRHAFELIAAQWVPQTHSLLFGGVGPGLGELQAVLRHLAARGATSLKDIVCGAWHDFQLACGARLGADGLAAIRKLVEQQLAAQLETHGPPPGISASPHPPRVPGLTHLAVLLDRQVAKLRDTPDCATGRASATLSCTGLLPRPPPLDRLRI